MNLKISAGVAIVSLAVGFLIAKKVYDKPQPQPQTSVAKASGSVKTVKVTKPNGEVTETVECASSAETINQNQAAKTLKRYSVSVSGLKNIEAIGADARLGDLPLFIGGIATKDSIKAQFRWEF